MSMTLMAGPRSQPYVYDTYGCPKEPAIIQHVSYLARMQSLLITVIKMMITIIRSKYNIIDKGLTSPISTIWFLVSPKKSNRDALLVFYMSQLISYGIKS